jgi:hypothetical protein
MQGYSPRREKREGDKVPPPPPHHNKTKLTKKQRKYASEAYARILKAHSHSMSGGSI